MPTANFPDSPILNQQYTFSGITWTWTGQYWQRTQQTSSGTAQNFYYSSSPPQSPVVGDRWINTDNLIELIYINDGTSSQWVEISSQSFATGTTAGGIIKTYNILNDFSAPLLGNQIFVPISNKYIKKIQITNGETAGVDIMLGIYKNNDLITFVTLPAGNITTTISDLNYLIQTNDYITVNVVSGSGKNLMMTMFDI